jgi:hypothetical protein
MSPPISCAKLLRFSEHSNSAALSIALCSSAEVVSVDAKIVVGTNNITINTATIVVVFVVVIILIIYGIHITFDTKMIIPIILLKSTML